MAKQKRPNVFMLRIDWNYHGDTAHSVRLFSTRQKTRKAMIEDLVEYEKNNSPYAGWHAIGFRSGTRIFKREDLDLQRLSRLPAYDKAFNDKHLNISFLRVFNGTYESSEDWMKYRIDEVEIE